ncbi:MFS transporter [Conexibacter arvalis]|uniref:EmrB/QacA subfamily drug resistance transporter n=1 Tax=Conexibacter arvalis TaxID=912552 RepID=A0A840I9D0_9ACTN|nr:MFS transporter [Conexibacter arvalis]MBB4660843.1 EmrB/QacA subfamily drug resistance transporter [Conexibacter arvalis]
MNATSAVAARPAAGRDNPWLTLAAVALGVMMVGLDGTVVGVANPTIAADLDASLAGLQWVTNGYLLALAVLLIVGGKLGDRFGRKKVFVIGIVGFAVTSLLCALSTSIGMLVFARVLQGVAGALLMPNTLALLRAAFPPAELNRAVGIWGGSSALAVASGPIVGGLLVEHVSWESIFLLNLPLGLIAALVTMRWVRESKDETHVGSFDLPGVALLSGGLFLLIWGVIKAQDHGWGSAYVIGFGAAGLLTLVLFVLREARAKEPLLPLDLFRNRSLSAGVVLVVTGFFALFGILFFIGLYLQNVHGYSPVETGVRLLPLTATFTVSAPLGGLLTEKFGPRVPLCLGMLILAGCFLGLTGLEVDTGYGGQWPFYLLIGIAMGLVIVASTEAIVGNAPVERGGLAGGLQSTANQLGGVLGTAVLGSVIVSGVGSALAGNLADAGVPAETAGVIEGKTELIAQGVAPISPDMPASLAQAVTDASFQSFMEGLHTAMYVSAGLAFLSALIALLCSRGHGGGDGVAVHV